MTELTEQNLLTELERVEAAIARSTTFTRWLDAAGGSHVKITENLLALAEREHAVVEEFKRRHRSPSHPLPAPAA